MAKSKTKNNDTDLPVRGRLLARRALASTQTGDNLGFEAKLRAAADALSNNNAIILALKKCRFWPTISATTPATPLHGSAPGGLLFSGAAK